MFALLNNLVVCGTVAGVAFLVLLSLPASRLRSVVLEILGWLVAISSAAYVASPLDVIPDFIPVIGWVDDGTAIVAGVVGAISALSTRSGRRHLLRFQGDDYEQL
jgi:uncharacterized membrane protein YkvA (DUF1232 family)